MLGQALLTRGMGKRRVIAETGAGQHGVATATAAALLGLECVVYMGEEDTRRQALNVARMRLLGAEVVPVDAGSSTLKDAINEAMRDWVTNVDHTHYLLGTVAGPHPFPSMVRDFQRIIGDEARAQVLELDRRGCRTRSWPASAAAPTRSASSPPSSTTPASGSTASRPAARASTRGGTRRGSPAARRACCTARGPTCCRTTMGQTVESHSISAGLDYPGVGPEHAWLHDTGRATYAPVTDAEAMDAFALLCRTEGIIPAIESAHALAGAMTVGRELGPDADVLVNLSGRGDKDVDTAAAWFGVVSDSAIVESAAAVVTAPTRPPAMAGEPAMTDRRTTRLDDVLAAARAEDRAALVGYLPAGFPTVDGAAEAMTAMVAAGSTSSRSACPTPTR